MYKISCNSVEMDWKRNIKQKANFKVKYNCIGFQWTKRFGNIIVENKYKLAVEPNYWSALINLKFLITFFENYSMFTSFQIVDP